MGTRPINNPIRKYLNFSVLFARHEKIGRVPIINWTCPHISVILAFLLGAVLRLWHLGRQSLWMDEAWSVWLSSHSPMRILKILETDAHPPLFYLILHFWGHPWDSPGGQSPLETGLPGVSPREWILRFPFALIGAFNGLLIYWLGRRTVGSKPAAAAALFWEISFAALFSETQVRMYSLIIFLSLAGTILFLRALEKSSGWRWFAYFGVSVLSLYTHYGGAWIVLCHLLYLASLSRRRILLAVSAGFLAVALPWYPVFLNQIFIRLAPRPGLGVREMLTFSGFLGGYDVLALSPANWILNLLAIGLVTVGALRARRDLGRLITLIFVVSFAVPFILTAATPLRIYLFRSAIVFAPYFFLLFFLGMAHVSKRLSIPLLGFLLFLNFGMDFLFLTQDGFQRQDWCPAVTVLDRELRPGDSVLFEHFMSIFPIWYYAPGRFEIDYSNYKFKIYSGTVPNRTFWIPVDQNTPETELAQISVVSKRVWLVLCDDWISDPSGKIPAWLLAHRRLGLRREFPSLDSNERIEVILFAPKT